MKWILSAVLFILLLSPLALAQTASSVQATTAEVEDTAIATPVVEPKPVEETAEVEATTVSDEPTDPCGGITCALYCEHYVPGSCGCECAPSPTDSGKVSVGNITSSKPTVTKSSSGKAEVVKDVTASSTRVYAEVGEAVTVESSTGEAKKPRVLTATEGQAIAEEEEVDESYTKLTNISIVSDVSGVSVVAVEAIEEKPIRVRAIGETAVIESGAVEATTSSKVSVEKSGIYVVSEAEAKTEIKVLPDKVRDIVVQEVAVTIIEKMELEVEETEPVYNINGEQEGKLFAFIPVRMRVETKVSAVTGEIKETKKPWWSFLILS